MEIIKDNHPPHGELSREADEAYRKGDYSEAIRLYTAALACLRRDAPWERERKVYLFSWLALSYQQVKAFAAARSAHESELRMARLLKDKEKEANALHRLGDSCIELKEDAAAERYLSESLKLFRSFGSDHREIPHLLFDLARIAESRKQSHVAVRYYREWIDVQQQRRAENLPQGWFRLGIVAAEQKDWQTAEDHFYTTLIIAQESGSALWESYALYGLGRLAVYGKRLDRAEYLMSQALSLAEQTKYRPLISSIHRGLGNIAFQKEDFATASRQYAQSLQMIIETESWDDAVTGLQNLAAAQLCLNRPGFAALSFAIVDVLREAHQTGAPSRFADTYRAKCRQAVSEATWQQAQERARTINVSEALTYFTEE